MRIMKSWAVGLTAALAVLGTAGAATAVAATNDSPGTTSASQSTGSGATSATSGSDKSSAAASDKASDKAADSKGSKDGAKRLCHRAPKIDKRLAHRLRKISDKGRGRGSTAHLEKRVANAKKAGHDDIATYLANRLDTRDAIAPKLKERKKDLGKVKTWCAAHHNGKS